MAPAGVMVRRVIWVPPKFTSLMTLNFRQGGLAVALASACATSILVLTPFAIWFGNRAEFSSDFIDIVRLVAPAAFVIAGVFGLLGLVLPISVGARVVGVLSALTVALWLQANIMNWHYGSLDGKLIDWSAHLSNGYVDTGVWLVLIGCALLAPQRMLLRLAQFAIAVWLLQVVVLSFTYLNLDNTSRAEKVALNTQAAATFSRHGNVLHIVADGFQSDIFGYLLKEKEGEFRETLSGFTFFSDHLTSYPYTQMTLPAILSGENYRNHKPITEFNRETLGGKNILQHARKNGYDVQLVVPDGGLSAAYANVADAPTFTVTTRLHLPQRTFNTVEGIQLIDLSLFRSVPHFAKPYIYNRQSWLLSQSMDDANAQRFYFFSHKRAVELMSEGLKVDDGNPRYKYVHLLLSHAPFVANFDCEYRGAPVGAVLEAVMDQSRCTLETFTELFDAMKAAGVYDNTTIVLMSDHGAWIPPQPPFTLPHPLDDRLIINPKYFGLARALLAVKPPGASGPLNVSHAPSAIEDTPNTVASLLGMPQIFGSGVSVFDLSESQARTRHFYLYEYAVRNWFEDGYLEPMMRFSVNGKSNQKSSWSYDQLFSPP
tara:strand:+ start:3609 stop:5408 length:1800 start_codon:yes stop_codon:yes gene_type:complete